MGPSHKGSKKHAKRKNEKTNAVLQENASDIIKNFKYTPTITVRTADSKFLQDMASRKSQQDAPRLKTPNTLRSSSGSRSSPTNIKSKPKLDNFIHDIKLSSTIIKKPSTKLKESVQSLAKTTQDRSKLSKNLVHILKSLKREYDKIETSFTSPTLSNINNPVMVINNRPLGPVNKNEKPDGVVNLDELIRHSKIKNSSKIRNVQEELDGIIRRHSFIPNKSFNNTESITIAKTSINLSNTKNENLLIQERNHEVVRQIQRNMNDITPRPMTNPIVSKKSSAITQARYSFSSTLTSTSRARSTHNLVLRDEIKIMRDKVDEAIKNHKIFTVYGNFYSIRQSLLARGWIEKLHVSHIPAKCDLNLMKRLQYLSIPELTIGMKNKDIGHAYKQIIYSKMIGNQPVSFYWDLNRETYRRNTENLKHATINFISKHQFNYSNKHGLCECAKYAHWYNNPGVSFLRIPRSYCLNTSNTDMEQFEYDFKINSAMSLLKWILVTHENNVSKLMSDCGKIPIGVFHFALEECSKFAQKLKHEDIDKSIPMAPDNKWNEFMDCFYKTVHVGNHFKQTTLETELSMVHKSKTMIKKLTTLFPFVNMDGYMNIWILKPSYGSRGIGIHFCRTLQYAMKVIKEHNKSIYVVQKYIERPLLIHNTKFDIRQWFLISSTQPLTIWIYKDCYLRFSSQTYNLRKLHESIHLTNNSVQSKYHNGNRDPCLPYHNMWHLKEFKEHLNSLGHPNVFDTFIYPGMKECITAAILTNQDQMYRSPKSFELHGADFMLTEDFLPWLIEINSKPALSPTTPVTSKMCPAVLEDVIKVVVDHARNPTSSTGKFELIYKEHIMNLPHIDINKFKVQGKPIEANYFLTPEQVKEEVEILKESNPNNYSNDSINIVKTSDYMKYVGKEMKNTLRQLLSLIERERNRRAKLRYKLESKENVDENLAYCKDMHEIKSNVHEIEEIFKLDQQAHKAVSNESVVISRSPSKKLDLMKASDSLLKRNSARIVKALSKLDSSINDDKDSSILANLLNIISDLSFTDKSKDVDKGTGEETINASQDKLFDVNNTPHARSAHKIVDKEK